MGVFHGICLLCVSIVSSELPHARVTQWCGRVMYSFQFSPEKQEQNVDIKLARRLQIPRHLREIERWFDAIPERFRANVPAAKLGQHLKNNA